MASAAGGRSPFNEADYMEVYFRLRAPHDEDEDVYLFGALTDWKVDRRFRMNYVARDGEYQARVLLKQGYYDYSYVTVGKDGLVRYGPTEGSHWETENNYTVFVYMRPIGQNFDLLIGKQTFNTVVK